MQRYFIVHFSHLNFSLQQQKQQQPEAVRHLPYLLANIGDRRVANQNESEMTLVFCFMQMSIEKCRLAKKTHRFDNNKSIPWKIHKNYLTQLDADDDGLRRGEKKLSASCISSEHFVSFVRRPEH